MRGAGCAGVGVWGCGGNRRRRARARVRVRESGQKDWREWWWWCVWGGKVRVTSPISG